MHELQLCSIFSHLQHKTSMLRCTCEYGTAVLSFAGQPAAKRSTTMSTFTKIVLPVIIAAGTSGLMFTAALI